MVVFTFKFPLKWILGSFLCVVVLSSCGLRDQLRGQRDQERTDETKRSIETTHETEDKYQGQLSDLAQKDLNSYHNYLLGLVGEYRGSYRDSDNSVTGRITVIVKIENDLGGLSPNAKITADQYRSMGTGMTLSVLVTEESGSGDGFLRAVCNQTGVKPDEATGRIHFACQTAGQASGRDYTFILNENATLIAGSSSKIENINASITSLYGENFTGRLQRHQVVSAVAQKGKSQNK